MRWCESQPQVEYGLAYPSNERLRTLTWGVEQRAKAAYEQQRQQIASTLAPLMTSTDLQRELDTLALNSAVY
jgi:hypothetical protein